MLVTERFLEHMFCLPLHIVCQPYTRRSRLKEKLQMGIIDLHDMWSWPICELLNDKNGPNSIFLTQWWGVNEKMHSKCPVESLSYIEPSIHTVSFDFLISPPFLLGCIDLVLNILVSLAWVPRASQSGIMEFQGPAPLFLPLFALQGLILSVSLCWRISQCHVFPRWVVYFLH